MDWNRETASSEPHLTHLRRRWFLPQTTPLWNPPVNVSGPVAQKPVDHGDNHRHRNLVVQTTLTALFVNTAINVIAVRLLWCFPIRPLEPLRYVYLSVPPYLRHGEVTAKATENYGVMLWRKWRKWPIAELTDNRLVTVLGTGFPGVLQYVNKILWLFDERGQPPRQAKEC